MHNFFLPLLLVVVTACNGQIKTDTLEDSGTLAKTPPAVNTKMVKTQGADPNISKHWNVHCSLQDKEGNLWFGTSGEGVYRYNGKVFTQFTEKNGLSNNSVWSVLEDKSGNIWFGTDDGVCRYDGEQISKMSFTPVNESDSEPQPKNPVWCMMQDKSGIIWFGTSSDLYCYDGKSFSRFLGNRNIINKDGLHLKWVQSLLEDRNGTIWIGSGPIAMEGVIHYDGKSITASKPNGDGWIRHILEDKNGTVWFGGRSGGVFCYKNNKFTLFTEQEGIGNPMLADKAGNIWFDGGEKQGTVESAGGIWCYDGKSFKNYSTESGMGKYSVWSMLEDRSGNIWIGTRNNGLYRFDGENFSCFSEE